MLKGNKGDWSEVYSLLKILSDQTLVAGNENLERIDSLIYPVIKILRTESNGTFEFSYDRDIVLVQNQDEQFRIPISQFHEQALFLLSELKKSKETTFAIPEIEEFLHSFNCHSLKARSSVKSDICIAIHDHRTGMSPELGFSIKSQLGSASTLLNAGKTTNFIYRVKDLTFSQEQITEINAIDGRSKVKDRIAQIQQESGVFEFIATENPILGANLSLIDSCLPQILSEMLLTFFSSKLSKTSDLVDEVTSRNPLHYPLENQHPFYSYKIKRFLTDVALGMMPSTVWTGEYDATGGYLVVKEDGDVLCYHIYNRNEFENYLLHNTKFDTASSTRHDFAQLYEEDGELRFKLNLQIRFIK